jgi:hypothetical protein
VNPDQAMPDSRAEGRSLRLILLLICLVLAVAGSVYLYLSGPARGLSIGAVNRIHSVTGFYAQPAGEGPLVLAFGDSIGMSAFDGYAYERLGQGGPIRACNLSRSQLSLAELLYDLDQPRLREARAILFVSPLMLAGTRHGRLNDQKANLYSVHGEGFDPGLVAEFEAAVPGADLSYALRPRWRHVLDSRWRIESALRQPIQDLRFFTRDHRAKGEELRRFLTDLKYPNFSGAVGPRELERQLAYDLGKLGPAFRCDPSSSAAVRFTCRELAGRSQGLAIVMAPLHPAIREKLPAGYLAGYSEALEELAAGQARILDLSAYLAADEFRDAHHCSLAGGTRLTEEIYRRLEGGV